MTQSIDKKVPTESISKGDDVLGTPPPSTKSSHYFKLKSEPWTMYVFAAVFGGHFLLELVVSHISHSLTLLVDSYHTLYNFMALLSYIVAIKMSRENRLRYTFGFARIEVVNVLVSILALCALCFSTSVEAIQTMLHASHSDAMHHPTVVCAIGVAGVVLNLICFLFVGGFSYSQSFLHVSPQEVQVNVTVPSSVVAGHKFGLSGVDGGAASLSSIPDVDDKQKGPTSTRHRVPPERRRSRCRTCQDICWDLTCPILVVICSLVVHASTTSAGDGQLALYIDPALSLVAAIFLLSTSYAHVKESGMILLQTVPSNMDVAEVTKKIINQFPTIKDVHDLHVWQLTKDKVIATAHVTFESPKAYSEIGAKLSAFFRDELAISQTTIQPEFPKERRSPPKAIGGGVVVVVDCVLRCQNVECKTRTCCTESRGQSVVQVPVSAAGGDTSTGIEPDTVQEVAASGSTIADAEECKSHRCDVKITRVDHTGSVCLEATSN